VEWISDCIAHLAAHALREIEADPDAERDWMEQVNAQARKSMISRTDSWMNGGNIPGKQRSYVFFFGHFGYYRKLCTRIAEQGYQGFVLS
jgi:cyclohexanone monooxygenase